MKRDMMGSQALSQAVDRRLLEYLVSLNDGASDQWEALGRTARDPEVRDLLAKTAAMQRKAARTLGELLPRYLTP